MTYGLRPYTSGAARAEKASRDLLSLRARLESLEAVEAVGRALQELRGSPSTDQQGHEDAEDAWFILAALQKALS